MARSAKKKLEATHAYVGYCGTCSGWVSLSVDDGTKRALSFCVGSDSIKRVTIEEARATKPCSCPREAA